MRAAICSSFRPYNAPKNRMFCSTVSASYNENLCDMYPMRRFTSSGSRLTSTPSTTAVPDVGFSSPHIMRMAVDLPAPFAPRNPKISPRSTAKLMRSTAVNAPNFRVRSRTRIAESAIIGPVPVQVARWRARHSRARA